MGGGILCSALSTLEGALPLLPGPYVVVVGAYCLTAAQHCPALPSTETGDTVLCVMKIIEGNMNPCCLLASSPGPDKSRRLPTTCTMTSRGGGRLSGDPTWSRVRQVCVLIL